MASEIGSAYISLTVKMAKDGMAEVTREVKKAGAGGGTAYGEGFTKAAADQVAKKLPDAVDRTVKSQQGPLSKSGRDAGGGFADGLNEGVRRGLRRIDMGGLVNSVSDAVNLATPIIDRLGTSFGFDVGPFDKSAKHVTDTLDEIARTPFVPEIVGAGVGKAIEAALKSGFAGAGLLFEAGVWTLPITALIVMNDLFPQEAKDALTAKTRGSTAGRQRAAEIAAGAPPEEPRHHPGEGPHGSPSQRQVLDDILRGVTGTGHAGGGAITGPGGTDKIPAWLTAGEHVLSAADVAKMGGQASVYAFRSMLPHFDGGGAVGAERWRNTVGQVFDQYAGAVGIPASQKQAWVNAIVTQIQTESGGNAGADNPHDTTGHGGTQHVSGLLQYLPSSYAGSGGKLTGLPFMDPIGQIAGALFAPRNAAGGPAIGVPGGIGTPGVGWGPNLGTAVSGAPGIGAKPGNPVYVQPVDSTGATTGGTTGGGPTAPTGLGPSGSFDPGDNPYARLAVIQQQQDALDAQKADAVKAALPDFGSLADNVGVQGIRENLPPGFFDYSSGKTAGSIGALLHSIGVLSGNPQVNSIMSGIGQGITGSGSGLYSGIMGAIPGPVGTLAPGQIGAPDLVAANSGGGSGNVNINGDVIDNSGKSLANADKTAQFNVNTPQATTLRRMGV